MPSKNGCDSCAPAALIGAGMIAWPAYGPVSDGAVLTERSWLPCSSSVNSTVPPPGGYHNHGLPCVPALSPVSVPGSSCSSSVVPTIANRPSTIGPLESTVAWNTRAPGPNGWRGSSNA